MRTGIALLIAFLIVVAGAGYLAWRQLPQVRELFESSGAEREDPLAFLKEEDKELAEARARKEAEAKAEKERKRASSSPRSASKGAESGAGPQPVPAKPLVPNADVARVLRGVLGAKRIGQNVQILVSDAKVELIGEVDSEEERREILRLVEKARETRTVDASALKVRP